MQRSRKLFQGTELIRLISMLGMLIVMGSLIIAMKKSHDHSAAAIAANRQPQADSVVPEKPTSELRTDPVVTRPDLTDQDPEQRAAALEEFQAVTDKTTEIQREEMAAYWRMLAWVHHQPFAELKKRANTNFVLNDLMQEPAIHRGELLRLDLNVRRVLEYQIPDNRLGVKKVYEVWGWTSESQAWPYVGIALELPPGFPTGPDVSARAIFCGYFFKLQGYLEAGANPRAKPLAAPLLLGRMEARPRPVTPAVGKNETPWLIGLGVLAGLMLLIRVGWLIHRRRTRQVAPTKARELESLPADQWLDAISSRTTPHPYESKPKLN